MDTGQPDAKQIKTARAPFAAMATTYFLGVFNDNFFKQAALLLAVGAGLASLQGSATMLFALPFILFSAWGGWLADRFTKRNVVIGVKLLELAAMAIGAYGIITLNWYCILAMVFLMALQSTLFSPALNGSIPELYPEHFVPTANAMLKVTTTSAVLAGTALAGIGLDQHWYELTIPFGRLLVAGAVLLIALLGIITSFGVARRTPTGVSRPFPWLGPIQSLKDVIGLKHDRPLLVAVLADGFFYFVASGSLLVINTLGLSELGLSRTATSMMSVALMAGVCLGSIVAARISRTCSWQRLLAPATACMGAGMLAPWAGSLLPESLRIAVTFGGLFAAGIAGGIFIIPVASFIQTRPAAADKGRIIGASNFVSFSAILGAGYLYSVAQPLGLPSVLLFGMGIICITIAPLFTLTARSQRRGRRGMVSRLALRGAASALSLLLRRRYQLTIKGLDHIERGDDERGIIFLPNHPALIDPVLVGTTLLQNGFAPRPVSDVHQARKPLVRHVLRAVNAIEIPDVGRDGRGVRQQTEAALRRAGEALNNGEHLLFYPAGRLYRSGREIVGGNSGTATILSHAPDARIVLVRTTGLWGSSFSWASGKPPALLRDVGRHLLRLVAGGFFFMPKRPVTIEFLEQADFPRHADKKSINTFLEQFYNEPNEPCTQVPYCRWRRAAGQVRAEGERAASPPDTASIDSTIKDQVMAKIAELAGVDAVRESDLVMADLGLDSLSALELAVWIEQTYGVAAEQTGDLTSVAHWIAAAGGQAGLTDTAASVPISRCWFAERGRQRLHPAAGENLAEIILNQAVAMADQPIVADRRSGVKTYRDLLTAVFVLLPQIKRLKDERIGIMLPASVASVIAWLSVMYSGKTPVMINWTVGERNLRHCLRTAKVSTIISASQLVGRLGRYGIDADRLAVDWFLLDRRAAAMSFTRKLTGVVQARFMPRRLATTPISETAVILFTSGSEAAPKAVPLSHRNIMANLADFAEAITFTLGDRLLGMLPPFHSLGFSGTQVMPLCLGLPTAYQPDPTQGAQIAAMVDDFAITVTVGTPTFIKNMMRAAAPGALTSLRLVFTGAEACPADVYRQFQHHCPNAVLCEGYGITECSPLVSINDPEHPRPGTIGRVLPSMETLIVHPETHQVQAPGERGMLLVAGPNVFAGYGGGNASSPFIYLLGKQWYKTGDLVVEEDGVLVFAGRLKRFVKKAGEMISLPAIEALLGDHFADRCSDGPCLAVESAGDGAHPELVLFTTFDVELDEINRAIRIGGLSSLHWISKVVRIDELPLLGTGKIDYKALQRKVAQDVPAVHDISADYTKLRN